MPAERALRTEQLGFGVHELILRFSKACRALLPVELVEYGFWIEGFDVAGTAGHEKEDDRFCLGLIRPVRGLGSKWITHSGAKVFLLNHTRQRQSAEAAESITDEFASIPG